MIFCLDTYASKGLNLSPSLSVSLSLTGSFSLSLRLSLTWQAHKRKTEDISKKLATLCDLLRESRV